MALYRFHTLDGKAASLKTPTTNRRSFLKAAPIAAFAAGVPAVVAASSTAAEFG